MTTDLALMSDAAKIFAMLSPTFMEENWEDVIKRFRLASQVEGMASVAAQFYMVWILRRSLWADAMVTVYEHPFNKALRWEKRELAPRDVRDRLTTLKYRQFRNQQEFLNWANENIMASSTYWSRYREVAIEIEAWETAHGTDDITKEALLEICERVVISKTIVTTVYDALFTIEKTSRNVSPSLGEPRVAAVKKLAANMGVEEELPPEGTPQFKAAAASLANSLAADSIDRVKGGEHKRSVRADIKKNLKPDGYVSAYTDEDGELRIKHELPSGDQWEDFDIGESQEWKVVFLDEDGNTVEYKDLPEYVAEWIRKRLSFKSVQE